LCDPARIQQALWNLLSNAIKFSSRGGHITVRLEPLAGAAQITVMDEGAGIPADFIPYVFEPFRQGGHFNTRLWSGLGVGLSIVKHIAQQHGGSVLVESLGEGKGATFTFTLPYAEEE
jgi:signal transduction histidine kinase